MSSNPQRTAPQGLVMGPIARRILCMLALVPIVPGLGMAVTVLSEDTLQSAGIDAQQYGHFCTAILATVAMLVLWRSFVLWTMGRRFLTASIAIVPFAQVLYPQPLWKTTGCFDLTDYFLRTGQHCADLGLGVWLVIWAWWGWEKTRMSGRTSGTVEFPRISSTAKRLIASVGLLPFTVGWSILAPSALEHFVGVKWNTGSALAGAAVPMVLFWIVIWRSAVEWSRPVIIDTVTGAALLIVLPIIAAGLWEPIPPTPLATMLDVLPAIGWGLWIARCAWVWPIRADASTDAYLTPRCSRCRYPLTGLKATRCPECGHEPTIDELWRANTGEVA